MKKEDDEVEHKASFDEQGNVVLKKKSKISSGKQARAAGARFELKVRHYWQEKGYVVDKWTNNVDLDKGAVVPAKRKFNPFRRVMTIGTGFPDFIVLKHIHGETYSVIGIEVKMNGLLSREEKEKCRVYLEKNVFSQILIAKKSEKRGEIEHIDFLEKWGT